MVCTVFLYSQATIFTLGFVKDYGVDSHMNVALTALLCLLALVSGCICDSHAIHSITCYNRPETACESVRSFGEQICRWENDSCQAKD